MNLSLGTLAVQLATLIGIDNSAKDAAGRFASAQVALQVAAAFKAYSAGDVDTATGIIFNNVIAKLTDPGQIAFATSIYNAGLLAIKTQLMINSALPAAEPLSVGLATLIATGITDIASTYKDPNAGKQA